MKDIVSNKLKLLIIVICILAIPSIFFVAQNEVRSNTNISGFEIIAGNITEPVNVEYRIGTSRFQKVLNPGETIRHEAPHRSLHLVSGNIEGVNNVVLFAADGAGNFHNLTTGRGLFGYEVVCDSGHMANNYNFNPANNEFNMTYDLCDGIPYKRIRVDSAETYGFYAASLGNFKAGIAEPNKCEPGRWYFDLDNTEGPFVKEKPDSNTSMEFWGTLGFEDVDNYWRDFWLNASQPGTHSVNVEWNWIVEGVEVWNTEPLLNYFPVACEKGFKGKITVTLYNQAGQIKFNNGDLFMDIEEVF